MSEEKICEFCEKSFSTIGALKLHQTTAKYCLKLQGKKDIEGDFVCKNCNKKFLLNDTLKRHSNSCKHGNEELKQVNIQLQNEIEILKKEIQILRQENEKNRTEYREIRTEYKQIVLSTVNKFNNISSTTEKNSSIINSEIGEYDLVPYLDIEKGCIIEYRKEDGYINIANLFINKKINFNDWYSEYKTETFLKILSSETSIKASMLIKYENRKKDIWVHPQIAINVGQYISPDIDIKISAWIHKIMISKKVDIGNTKIYREIIAENIDKESKIKFLTKKYVKKQSREDYPENYVVYITTTKNLAGERIYIMGKSKILKNRMSTYNKTEEHEVIYFQGCGDEESMNIAENLILKKMEKYRVQANRDRFLLPENEEIDLFINLVKENIAFVKK